MIVNRGFGSWNIITQGYGGIPAVPIPVTGGGGWSVRRPTYRTLSIDLDGIVYKEHLDSIALKGDIYKSGELSHRLFGLIIKHDQIKHGLGGSVLNHRDMDICGDIYLPGGISTVLSGTVYKNLKSELGLSGQISLTALSSAIDNDEMFLFTALNIIKRMNQ